MANWTPVNQTKTKSINIWDIITHNHYHTYHTKLPQTPVKKILVVVDPDA